MNEDHVSRNRHRIYGRSARRLADNQTVLGTIRQAFKTADAAGDEATLDLLNARTAAHAKHAWMLRASLGRQ